ncbi:MAG: substrate-binding domain-containing protein [Armatimonadota bacterium]|nr:substrate-binding domain-containing protein [Armatimonadota bacterium]MDR7443197.1 substrate-binding domain-containing protein [Armatimonadota bacterium]MDR7571104.1 substrate-binding domain-containing protein [Armatimonadota bacterium]MDR7614587.1 substrate-binding domain-containing protein [Armatimonadota bacterium]
MRKWLGLLVGVCLLGWAAAVQGAAPLPELRERARREGTVVFLTSVSQLGEPLRLRFEEGNPGVRVQLVLDPNAPSRVVAEALAGRRNYDVLLWSLPGLSLVRGRGLLRPYVAREDLAPHGVPVGVLTLDGYGLRFISGVYAVAYRPGRIRAEEVPRTWEDLLQERWRNRLVGDAIAVGNWIAGLGVLRGEEWAFQYARRLREMGLAVVPQPTAVEQLVLRGDRDLWVGAFAHQVEQRKMAGVALEWAPVGPVTYASQFALAILQGAPHPEAARLFAIWYMTREGRAALEREGFWDVAPGSGTFIRKRYDQRGIRIVLEDERRALRRVELFERIRRIVLGEER